MDALTELASNQLAETLALKPTQITAKFDAVSVRRRTLRATGTNSFTISITFSIVPATTSQATRLKTTFAGPITFAALFKQQFSDANPTLTLDTVRVALDGALVSSPPPPPVHEKQQSPAPSTSNSDTMTAVGIVIGVFFGVLLFLGIVYIAVKRREPPKTVDTMPLSYRRTSARGHQR